VKGYLLILNLRVEQNIVIIAACVPTLRPFFHRVWGHRFTTKKSNSTPGNAFASISTGRARVRHSDTDFAANVALESIYSHDYAVSQESQQNILHTIEVSGEKTVVPLP
jgi:hypothetical protein